MYQMLAKSAFDAFGASQRGRVNAARAGDAAYEQVSRQLANRFRAAARMDAATKNLFAIKQDSITANRKILDAQAEAESDAKVAAAFAGSEGGSVRAVEYQTEVSAALASDTVRRQAAQEEQNLINQVYGAAYDLAQKSELPAINTNYKGMLDSAASIWDSGGKEVASKLWSKFVPSDKSGDNIAGDRTQTPKLWSID